MAYAAWEAIGGLLKCQFYWKNLGKNLQIAFVAQ